MQSESSPIPPPEKSKPPKQYLREARRTLEEIPDALERTIDGTAQALRFLIDACIPAEKQSLTIENVVDIGIEFPSLRIALVTCIGILATIPPGMGMYAAVHPEKVRELSNAAQDAQARVQDLKQNVERVIQEHAEDEESRKLYEARIVQAEKNQEAYPDDYVEYKDFLKQAQYEEKPFSGGNFGYATYWHEAFTYGEDLDRLDEGDQAINRISVEVHNFIKVFNEKNDRSPSWIEVYNGVIGKYMGAQDDHQDSAYILALTGVGNCQARAKLIALIMERAFPEANDLHESLGVDLYGAYRDEDGKRHAGHIELRLGQNTGKEARVLGGRRITSKPSFESTSYLADRYYLDQILATTPLSFPQTAQDKGLSHYNTLAQQISSEQLFFANGLGISEYPPSSFQYSGNGGGIDPLEEVTEEKDPYAPYKEPTADEQAYRKEQERKTLHEKVLERVHIAEEDAEKSFSPQDPQFLAKLQELLDADPFYPKAQEKYNAYINLQDSFSYSEQDELRNSSLVAEQEKTAKEMRDKFTEEYVDFLAQFDIDHNFPPIDWEKKIMYVPSNTRNGKILFHGPDDDRLSPIYYKILSFNPAMQRKLVITNEAGLVNALEENGFGILVLSFVPSRENFAALENSFNFTNIALFRDAAERYPDLEKNTAFAISSNTELLQYMEFIQKTHWKVSAIRYAGNDAMNLTFLAQNMRNNLSIESDWGYSGELNLKNTNVETVSIRTHENSPSTFLAFENNTRLPHIKILVDSPIHVLFSELTQPVIFEVGKNTKKINMSFNGILTFPFNTIDTTISTVPREIIVTGLPGTRIEHFSDIGRSIFFGSEETTLPQIEVATEKIELDLFMACIGSENTLTFSPKAQEKIHTFLTSAYKFNPDVSIFIRAPSDSTITPQQIQAEMQRIFPKYKRNFVAE